MISSQYISRVSLRRDIVASFDRYPFSLPAVRSLEALDLHPRVTFFIGENGSGKSTLLEAIAVSTHSPILMAYPDAWIYAFDREGIRRVAYEDTEHYQVTRDFLANPKRMLDVLLERPAGS